VAAFRGGRLSLGFVVADPAPRGRFLGSSFLCRARPSEAGRFFSRRGTIHRAQAFRAAAWLRFRRENVGAPTFSIDIVVNTAEENKRVIGEHILQNAPPPPCFCVCTGMIGLTGVFRGCTGIAGLSMRKSEEKTKRSGKAVEKTVKEEFPRWARAGWCRVFTTHRSTLFTNCQ